MFRRSKNQVILRFIVDLLCPYVFLRVNVSGRGGGGLLDCMSTWKWWLHFVKLQRMLLVVYHINEERKNENVMSIVNVFFLFFFVVVISSGALLLVRKEYDWKCFAACHGVNQCHSNINAHNKRKIGTCVFSYIPHFRKVRESSQCIPQTIPCISSTNSLQQEICVVINWVDQIIVLCSIFCIKMNDCHISEHKRTHALLLSSMIDSLLFCNFSWRANRVVKFPDMKQWHIMNISWGTFWRCCCDNTMLRVWTYLHEVDWSQFYDPKLQLDQHINRRKRKKQISLAL